MKIKAKKKRSPQNIPYYSISLIFIFTLITRLLFVLSMRHHAFSIITRYTIDTFYYHNWALQIAQGDWVGKEAFFLGPFYAYFLAIIYKLGGNVLTVQIIQSILASFSCVFLYLITRKISNHRNGIIASIIYIFSGILVFYTGTLLYVEVNIFFSLWLAYLLLIIQEQFSVKLLLLTGVVMGLLTIVRPEFILLFLLLIPYFLIKVKIKPALQYILFLFFALITISIIPLRNYLVSKDFVPFTAHSGINFYYGNNPQTDGTWRPTYPLQQTPDITIEQLKYSSQRIDGQIVKPSVASNYWLKKGIAFIKENPTRYLKLLTRKLLLFINGYEIPNNYYFYQTRDDSLVLKIAFINFALILPLAILGIILSLKRWRDYYLAYAFIFIYLISSLIFYVLSRLRIGVMPFFIIFAAFFITELWSRLRTQKFKSALILVILAGLLYGLTQLRLFDKNEFNIQGYIQKGNIYQSIRNFNQAALAYQKAIAIDPSNIITHYSLLQTYISMNKPSQALQELQIITNLAQQNPQYQLYAHLAQARFSIANRNFTQAAQEFEKALLLNPYDAEIHYLLGAVYITLGRNQQALKEIKKTLELDPNHSDAQRALQMLQSNQSK
ncbi:MAG: tetratricopeptide repeat protein [candidate division WOR-3 bacterium]